jgi:hypothetical protein
MEFVLVLTEVLRLASFGPFEVDSLDSVDAEVGGLPLGGLRGFGKSEARGAALTLESG